MRRLESSLCPLGAVAFEWDDPIEGMKNRAAERTAPRFRVAMAPVPTEGSKMNIPPEATHLSLYLNANDRLKGKALYRLVVETARADHLAGASVFLVDFSYGTHKRIRDAKSEYLSFDIPVVVEIVDSPERIGKLQADLDPLITEGLVVTRPVQVRHYAGQSLPRCQARQRRPIKLLPRR